MLKMGGNVRVRARVQGTIIFCVFVGQMSTFIFSCCVGGQDSGGPVASIPTIMESKLGASFPHLGSSSLPPLSDSSPPSLGLIVEGVDCPVKMGGLLGVLIA